MWLSRRKQAQEHRSHYWITKTADQGIDEEMPTQVKCALDQLGITLIPASAPDARGRSERIFGTQGRLPQALRAAAITTMAAANQHLSEVFLPAHIPSGPTTAAKSWAT